MSKKEQRWSIGDSIPSIEVDSEIWSKLDGAGKVRYVYTLLTQDKGLEDRLAILNFIVTNMAKIVNVFTKNDELREYVNIVEQSTNLLNVSTVIGNIVKVKQHYVDSKYNEMAKLMGYPNGSYVDMKEYNISYQMLDPFLSMTSHQQSRHGITINKIIGLEPEDGDSKPEDGDSNNDSTDDDIKRVKVLVEFREDKFGLDFIVDSVDDETKIRNADLRVFFEKSNYSAQNNTKDIRDIIFAVFVESIDTRKNYVRLVDGSFEVSPRKDISAKIMNLDIDRMYGAMDTVLSEKRRRGVVLVGEPGVGKTISVHKLINMFPDRLAFWVSAQTLSTSRSIIDVFTLVKMFRKKPPIVIFDDLDSAAISSKNEVTGELLNQLDGTNNRDLSGFFIATVNDPSAVHMAIINRPERFDDVIILHTPKTEEEISVILESKCAEFGFIGDRNKIKTTTKKYKELVKEILDNDFTQVQVAGLVRDCYDYSCGNPLTIDMLSGAVSRRIDSIHASNTRASCGKLIPPPIEAEA